MTRNGWSGMPALALCTLLLAGCVTPRSAAPAGPAKPHLSVQLPPTVWTPADWQQDGKLRRWSRDQNGNFVDDVIDAEAPAKQVTAIVDLNACVNGPEDVAFLRQYGDVVYVGRYVSYAILTGLEAGRAAELARRPEVAMIELASGGKWMDTERQAMKVEASSAYPNASLAAANGWPATLNGAGRNIAILDSGVNDGLAELAGRYRFGYDATTSPGQFVNPPPVAMPGLPDGHGTEMARIAIGSGIHGIAPGAGLVDVKIGDASGWKSAALADAFDVMLDKRQAWSIDVVNLATGGAQASDGRDAISQHVNRLVAAGIAVVAAAGNGPSQGSAKISYPGAASWALTVGAADPGTTANRSDDVIATSTPGPRDDDKDADPLDELKPEIAASSCCGSSPAAARISGLAALLLQKAPDLNPGSLRDLLIRTAEDRDASATKVAYPKNTPTWDADWGFGLVDAFAAVNALKKGPDLTFIGFDGSAHPSAPWYFSHAVQTQSGRDAKSVAGGVADKVFARIVNRGTQDASYVRVSFGFYTFAASIPRFEEIGSVLVPTLPAGKPLEVSVDWVPPVLPAGKEHGCIVVTIDYGPDGDFAKMSNLAQLNVQVKPTSSPATFTFDVANPLPGDARIDLDVAADRSTKADLSTWKVALADVSTTKPGRCARTIRATVTPPPGTPAGTTARFYVTATGTAGRLQQTDLGGVALEVVTR